MDLDDEIYEAVAAEIKSGLIKDGLWLKATIDAEGNEAKAKSLYAKYRISQVKEEIEKEFIENAQKEKANVSELRNIESFLAARKCSVRKHSSGYNLLEPNGNSKDFSTLKELISHVSKNWQVL